MELVYLWVKKCGLYNNQGFHFGSRFKIQFDEISNILLIEQNESRDDTFRLINSVYVLPREWNINNLTMLVGNNGVGKTTLLKTIGLLNSEGNAEKKIKEFCGAALVVYYDKELDELSYVYLVDEYPKTHLTVRANRNVKELTSLKNNINFVYYSGIFANEIEIVNKKYDISTMGLLADKRRNQFFYDELERQMMFYERYRYYDNLQFDFLDNLFKGATNRRDAKVINVGIRKSGLSDSVMGRVRRSNVDREQDLFVWFVKKLHAARVNNLYEHISKSVMVLLLVEMYKEYRNTHMSSKYYYPLLTKLIELEVECITGTKEWSAGEYGLEFMDLEQMNEINADTMHRLYILLKKHYYKGDRNTKYFNSSDESNEGMLDSIKYALEQHMVDGDVVNRWIKYFSDEHNEKNENTQVSDILHFIYMIRERWGEFQNGNTIDLAFDDARNLYSEYKNLTFANGYDFLSFGWRMSAGESAVLNFFARLEGIKDVLKENVVLLMDEPDLNLHPALQQEFVEYLYKYINLWYAEKNVSIIISTHSPLLLSDISKRNIIFFRQNQEGMIYVIDWTHESFWEISETFGGNIHSLFYNSFFMENGSIGSHARNLIELLFDQLDGNIDGKKELFTMQEVERIIDSLGEPILRKQARLRLKK